MVFSSGSFPVNDLYALVQSFKIDSKRLIISPIDPTHYQICLINVSGDGSGKMIPLLPSLLKDAFQNVNAFAKKCGREPLIRSYRTSKGIFQVTATKWGSPPQSAPATAHRSYVIGGVPQNVSKEYILEVAKSFGTSATTEWDSVSLLVRRNELGQYFVVIEDSNPGPLSPLKAFEAATASNESSFYDSTLGNAIYLKPYSSFKTPYFTNVRVINGKKVALPSIAQIKTPLPPSVQEQELYKSIRQIYEQHNRPASKPASLSPPSSPIGQGSSHTSPLNRSASPLNSPELLSVSLDSSDEVEDFQLETSPLSKKSDTDSDGFKQVALRGGKNKNQPKILPTPFLSQTQTNYFQNLELDSQEVDENVEETKTSPTTNTNTNQNSTNIVTTSSSSSSVAPDVGDKTDANDGSTTCTKRHCKTNQRIIKR